MAARFVGVRAGGCKLGLGTSRRPRFFFPWPFQPHQVYDENTQRVALRRRLVEDDQWVVPHNLCFTMFSTSSVNVIGFDPTRNVDQARGYATKYCAKTEKWCRDSKATAWSL